MGGIGRFAVYRLLRMMVALWTVVTVVFIVMRLSGDPVPLMLPPDAPIAEMERVRADLGLDRPLLVQYGVFIHHAMRGDFGRSIHFRTPAMKVVWERVPATIQLALASFSRFGRRALRPRATTVNSGTGMRWYWSSFFDSALSRARNMPRGLHPV